MVTEALEVTFLKIFYIAFENLRQQYNFSMVTEALEVTTLKCFYIAFEISTFRQAQCNAGSIQWNLGQQYNFSMVTEALDGD